MLEVYIAWNVLFIPIDSIKSVNWGHFSELAIASQTLWVFFYVNANSLKIFVLGFFLLVNKRILSFDLINPCITLFFDNAVGIFVNDTCSLTVLVVLVLLNEAKVLFDFSDSVLRLT